MTAPHYGCHNPAAVEILRKVKDGKEIEVLVNRKLALFALRRMLGTFKLNGNEDVEFDECPLHKYVMDAVNSKYLSVEDHMEIVRAFKVLVNLSH